MITVGPFPDPEPSIKNITKKKTKMEMNEEDERKLFAEELFRISWEAWERRDEGKRETSCNIWALDIGSTLICSLDLENWEIPQELCVCRWTKQGPLN